MLDAYTAKRANAAPLPSGSAPHVSSAQFKSKQAHTSTGMGLMAKHWDHKFSHEARRRLTSTLKASSRVTDPSAVISLGTARPAPQYYPWQSITIDATDVREPRDAQSGLSTVSMICSKGEDVYDLGLALNYGYAAGSPQVLRFITEHVEAIHRPRYEDWECALTCGTTSAIDIVLRMLCDCGASILTEAYTYPGTIEAARSLGIEIFGVEMDEVGMRPDALTRILEGWDQTKGPKPSVLYVIPTGQNPTGATQTIERRKEIYSIAEEHDLLILEDDPYYFIQLSANDDFKMTHKQFLHNLPPSYLSLDTQGIVIRLDATSKILAPGLRCGWITASAQIIEKFLNHSEMSTIAPSGPSQMLLYKLLDETWGHAGFLEWLIRLSSQYRLRLCTLTRACETFLPPGICTWTTPDSGMFLWLKLDWQRHPIARENGSCIASEVEDRIYSAARGENVLISKGSWFAGNRKAVDEVSFRLTFAAAVDEALETAVKRLGRALKKEFQL